MKIDNIDRKNLIKSGTTAKLFISLVKTAGKMQTQILLAHIKTCVILNFSINIFDKTLSITHIIFAHGKLRSIGTLGYIE